MYATYMGQKPCIDEGHAMTQERYLYIQLDMANGEGAVVFLFALEGQCLIILTIYVKAFFFKNKTWLFAK